MSALKSFDIGFTAVLLVAETRFSVNRFRWHGTYVGKPKHGDIMKARQPTGRQNGRTVGGSELWGFVCTDGASACGRFGRKNGC